MWYVKDEFSNKVYFKSQDVRKTQAFAIRYNSTYKFAGQRYFKFNISDFCGFGFLEDKVDINAFTKSGWLFRNNKYFHPLAVKGFQQKHVRYVDTKLKLIKLLCKKYHLWSYTKDGRKCDGFDF